MCLEECSAHETHLFKGDTLKRAVFMAVLQFSIFTESGSSASFLCT